MGVQLIAEGVEATGDHSSSTCFAFRKQRVGDSIDEIDHALESRIKCGKINLVILGPAVVQLYPFLTEILCLTRNACRDSAPNDRCECSCQRARLTIPWTSVRWGYARLVYRRRLEELAPRGQYTRCAFNRVVMNDPS